MLASLRSDGIWDVDLARAEGNCAARRGDEALARVAFEEAVLLDPNDAEAWFGLAQTSMPEPSDPSSEVNFDVAMSGLADTAWTSSRVPLMIAIAEAWAAYRRGVDVDWALIELRRSVASWRGDQRSARSEANALEGRVALDHGDAIAANEILLQAVLETRRAPRVGSWRAEALRRMGDAGAAEQVLTTGRASRGEHWAQDAVMARVLADQGRFDDARRTLARAPATEPDVIASFWYVALRSNDGTAELWKHRWAAAMPPAGAQLTHLIPWSTPAP